MTNFLVDAGGGCEHNEFWVRLARPFGSTIGVDLILKDLFLLYSVCLTPRGPVAGFKVAYSLATVLGPALPN